jgi:hypothetical protein
LQAGLIDELAADRDELLAKARLDRRQSDSGAALGREGLPDSRWHAVEPESRADAGDCAVDPAQQNPGHAARAGKILCAAVEGARWISTPRT